MLFFGSILFITLLTVTAVSPYMSDFHWIYSGRNHSAQIRSWWPYVPGSAGYPDSAWCRHFASLLGVDPGKQVSKCDGNDNICKQATHIMCNSFWDHAQQVISRSKLPEQRPAVSPHTLHAKDYLRLNSTTSEFLCIVSCFVFVDKHSKAELWIQCDPKVGDPSNMNIHITRTRTRTPLRYIV